MTPVSSEPSHTGPDHAVYEIVPCVARIPSAAECENRHRIDADLRCEGCLYDYDQPGRRVDLSSGTPVERQSFEQDDENGYFGFDLWVERPPTEGNSE